MSASNDLVKSKDRWHDKRFGFSCNNFFHSLKVKLKPPKVKYLLEWSSKVTLFLIWNINPTSVSDRFLLLYLLLLLPYIIELFNMTLTMPNLWVFIYLLLSVSSFHKAEHIIKNAIWICCHLSEIHIFQFSWIQHRFLNSFYHAKFILVFWDLDSEHNNDAYMTYHILMPFSPWLRQVFKSMITTWLSQPIRECAYGINLKSH